MQDDHQLPTLLEKGRADLLIITGKLRHKVSGAGVRANMSDARAFPMWLRPSFRKATYFSPELSKKHSLRGKSAGDIAYIFPWSRDMIGLARSRMMTILMGRTTMLRR